MSSALRLRTFVSGSFRFRDVVDRRLDMLAQMISGTFRLAKPIFRLCPKLEFVVALSAAAGHELLQKAKHIRGALRGKAAVPRELSDLRLAICEKCPIFYAPLRTCGSALPGGARDEHGGVVGCGCWMPAKARTLDNCWLYDQAHGQTICGWPASLNSFPIEEEENTHESVRQRD